MALSTSTISSRRSTGRIGQSEISGESQRQRPLTASTHILNDDSILHVFYLCRPSEDDIAGSSFGRWKSNIYWWNTLAHVCRRWRNIVLGSATYLGLSLVCTYGTPVADMLAHSPPLPLIIGYFRNYREYTTEDQEGIILALKQRDRVRHIRLSNAAAILQKFFVVMDEEYPILEFLYITRPTEDKSTILTFPGTLQAPRSRYLMLQGFALPIGSRLIATAVGLVTLHLAMIHPSTYFYPNTLIQWVSLMPQLETLIIYFEFSVPNRVERQLTHTTITAPITLPNLHRFHFRGISTYLEALVHRITAPRLDFVEINFFNQLTFSVPRLVQFIYAAGNFGFDDAVLTFSDKKVGIGVTPHGETKGFPLGILVKCWHLDWQVSSMIQIFDSLSQIFSVVERLVLQHEVHSETSEEHNEVDRTEWRKLLWPFRNVKTLRIQNGLVKDLSRCLQSEDGDPPLELLPELQALEYLGGRDAGDGFTSFIDARRDAGRPVTLVRL